MHTEDLLGPQRRACQRTLANPKLETLHVMHPEHLVGGAQWRARQYTPKPRSKYDTRPQRGGPLGPSGRGPRRGGRGAGGGLMQDAEDSEEEDNNRFGQRGGLDGWGEEEDKPREWVPPPLHPSSEWRYRHSTAQHPLPEEYRCKLSREDGAAASTSAGRRKTFGSGSPDPA